MNEQPSVDQWMKHFISVIKGDIGPDNRRDIFLFEKTPTKKPADIEQKQPITIISPIAKEVDTAKSELAEQKQLNLPNDNDPISHFPEQVAAERVTLTQGNRKRRNNKETTTSKAKKSYWKKY